MKTDNRFFGNYCTFLLDYTVLSLKDSITCSRFVVDSYGFRSKWTGRVAICYSDIQIMH